MNHTLHNYAAKTFSKNNITAALLCLSLALGHTYARATAAEEAINKPNDKSLDNQNANQVEITPKRLEEGRYVTREFKTGFYLYDQSQSKQDLNTITGFNDAKTQLIKFLKQYSEKNNEKPKHGVILNGSNEQDMQELALAFGASINGSYSIVVEASDLYKWSAGGGPLRELFGFAEQKQTFFIIIQNIDDLITNMDNLGDKPISYTFNEILDKIYNENESVIVVGLTTKINRVNKSAMLPGRLSTIIDVDVPDAAERKVIINDFSKTASIQGITVDEMVELTSSLSKHNIRLAMNNAHLLANLANKNASKEHFEQSVSAINKQLDTINHLAGSDHARLIPRDRIKTRFSDIVGQDAVKEEAKQMVKMVLNNEGQKYNIKIPHGMLLYGPPGTGKTMFARALAGESDMNFIAVSGSSIKSMWIGEGQQRLAELFNYARKHKPCILFIDEIDALAGKRGSEQSQEDSSRIVNQLLFEMDGVDESLNEGIIIIGATNKLSSIDEAVLRPGRFDKKIMVGLPNLDERKKLIDFFAGKVDVKTTFDRENLAEVTSGFSPAEIHNVINEAYLYVVRNDLKEISDDAITYVQHSIFSSQSAVAKGGTELDVDIFRPLEVQTTFKDVPGLIEVKEEVRQSIDIMKNQKKYLKVGATLPKGIMFYGPPGTGKTLLARAIAGESNLTFISVSGSSFVDRYVGVGAERVRELFEIARQYSPCVLFIDEMDAVAPPRGGGGDGGSKEYNQTVNQLLTELDNVDKDRNSGVFIIAATNRLENIDSALLRPGRFDRKILVGNPNYKERIEIVDYFLKKYQTASDVKAETIAITTGGLSGADIESLINQAAIEAVNRQKEKLTMKEIEFAKDKILLGLEVKSVDVLENERKKTAYHEAGHTIVGLFSKNQPMPFYKVSVAVRNGTLGTAHFKDDDTLFSWSREMYYDFIATLMGGKMAEEIFRGKQFVTGGPSNDLERATRMAQQMVMNLGLGTKREFISYGQLKNPPSDEINDQIMAILAEGEKRAREILTTHEDKLKLLAEELLKKETMDEVEVKQLLGIQ